MVCGFIDTADNRACLLAERQVGYTASQGKLREGFCGFPACPAEFAVPQGLGELGSTRVLL